ncbi:hypothetical protein RNAN_0351 [Rheinheimera nanhaiensis E407-8]|uniref:Uncharacterized protein n=1 Tax=Rheinheimera nanhaiensis E407-8 TaxID=562729 RepID=I1DTK5_9GAMM|nr:hypothetical protein RNAN_0351 [Rheinheimera nanhaiensis E407-8]
MHPLWWGQAAAFYRQRRQNVYFYSKQTLIDKLMLTAKTCSL